MISDYRAMLDTNIVSALIRDPRGKLYDAIEVFGPQGLCMSIVSLGELRYGLAHRPSRRVATSLAQLLTHITAVALETPAEDHYGAIRAHLRARGTPIGPNDIWIAAHALALDVTLVTANTGEFSRVPNLRIENWLN